MQSKACDSSEHMKAPGKEIYSKSTICDFLLMVNSNRDNITFQCKILVHAEVENHHFWLLYSDCTV